MELLVDHGDVALAYGLAGHVHAVHQHSALIGFVEAGHQPHQAGLSGQRASQKDIERTGFQYQRCVVDVQLVFHTTSDLLEHKGHGGAFFIIGSGCSFASVRLLANPER
ncbi:hypothetical protein ABMD26_003824 [Pseudomonas sp. PvP001]